ncbi:hypothetical protein BG004_006506 [Podila humilis]|nr:hypothetical protein BG004_006506 [Podila humilis]
MDAGQNQRHGPDPSQRRVRHIQCITARNLTFTQNANHRTLASALAQPNALNHVNNAGLQTQPYSVRSITPSIELPSGASSPTKGYFRSPWKNYPGIQKVRGPGSDTGSTSASESGRTSSLIREPIARLSAGLKASVFNVTSETGYTSESGSGFGSDITTTRTRPRTSNDFSGGVPTRDRLDVLVGGSGSSWSVREPIPSVRLGHSVSVPSTPPSSLARDKLLSPSNITNSIPSKDSVEAPLLRNEIKKGLSRRNAENHSALNVDDSRLPSFVNKGIGASTPILLDSYFTLHDPTNDAVIYTSETVASSNNPKYGTIEKHLFSEDAATRSSSVTIKIWAGLRGSEATLLLEWKVQLCCLRFIGNDLRTIPSGLPNNTIIFGFENGFYTASDDEDVIDHTAHSGVQDSIPAPPNLARRSYTYESVMRLNNLHECVADTKKSRDEIKNNIDMALKKDNASIVMVFHPEFAQDRAEALRKEHAARRQALVDSRERGAIQDMYLEENMTNLTNNKESLFNTLKDYSTKRIELIATLFTIFPITETETDPNMLKVCNVPLPNSVYTGYDEEMVAVSLGFVCHFVTMLAHYLNVPLRYPLTPMGSRSFVVDPVSLLVGPREFPLFGKGQDRHRFEYGVFLLNKDVEQLMNSQGLQFMDLRQTLPNLRYLMETLLTTSPTQSMLYRSKFMNRKKQDRIEQDRLNDLFMIALEQKEFEHILNPAKYEGVSTDSERHRHEKQSSKGSSSVAPVESRRVTNVSSERMPLLVREYDPIDGEYTLILTDPTSPKSNTIRGSAAIGKSKLNDGSDTYRTPRVGYSSSQSQGFEQFDSSTEEEHVDDAEMMAVGEKFDSTRESITGSTVTQGSSGTQESSVVTSALTRILMDSASNGDTASRVLNQTSPRRFSSANVNNDTLKLRPYSPTSPTSPKFNPGTQLANEHDRKEQRTALVKNQWQPS